MLSLTISAAERRPTREWIREHEAFLGYEMRGPARTGRGGVSMVGGREGQGVRKGNGVRGHRCHHRHVLSRICLCISAFYHSISMRKVAGEHPFCVLMYMISYIFHIYFIILFSCQIHI